MGRKKGTPKTGGRKPGTPNKATAAVKGYLADVLQNYLQPQTKKKSKPTLEEDLQNMLPAERVRAVAQLAAYVIPKQQTITLDEQVQIEAEALTQWLETAPAEAIDAIAAKVLELQRINQQAPTLS